MQQVSPNGDGGRRNWSGWDGRCGGDSRASFAKRFEFTTNAVREWEQDRRQLEPMARRLVLVIASKPEVVNEVLSWLVRLGQVKVDFVTPVTSVRVIFVESGSVTTVEPFTTCALATAFVTAFAP